MNFRDLALKDGQPVEGAVPGLLFESEDGRWRVAASDMGDPPFTWCIHQRRRGGWVQRLAWLAMASPEEAMMAVRLLAALPLSASPLHVRDALEWQARRAATTAVAAVVLRGMRLAGEFVLRRQAVRDINAAADEQVDAAYEAIQRSRAARSAGDL